MTESEAIKSALKKVKAQQDNLGGFMDRFDISEHWAVRKALEKQIPKKPDECEDRYYACPVCDNILLHKWIRYPAKLMQKTEGLPHCMSCGQAIDWSEE